MHGLTLPRTVFSVVLGVAGCLGLFAAGPDFFQNPPATQVLDPESRMALGFLTEAQKSFAVGKLELAAAWVDRGLQIDPACSDLLVLQARLFWQSGQPAWRSIAADVAALKSQRWVQGRYADAFLDLVDRLVDTHEYKQAKKEFTQRMSDRDILKDPRLASRKILILHALGEHQASRALMDQASVMWPDDLGLAEVAFRYSLVPPATAHRWFDRFKSSQPIYRKALFWYISGLPPSAERLRRCQEYLDLGGGDRMAYPWALESAILLDPAARTSLESTWLQRFLPTIKDLDLEAAKNLDGVMQSPDLKKALRDQINIACTMGYRDFDHDGLAEERVGLDKGALLSWTVDGNQDRLAELKLSWEDGRLVGATQSTVGRTVRAEFSAYPEIARLEVLDEQGAWTLGLPHRLQEIQFIELPAVSPDCILDWLPFLDLRGADVNLDPGRILKSADSMVRYRGGSPESGRLSEEIRLQDGLPTSSRDDSDGDGTLDHLVWYENGLPVMGFRDIENTGAFDGIEIYRAGKLSEVQYTNAKEGLHYRFVPGTGRSEWDLNHDGIVDVSELRDAARGLVQSFSTRLDGVFDIQAADGVITSVLLPAWFN